MQRGLRDSVFFFFFFLWGGGAFRVLGGLGI